jgi:hypothetical protein
MLVIMIVDCFGADYDGGYIMKILLIGLVLAGVLVLCGCGGPTHVWYKYGASNGQTMRDKRECLKKAEIERFTRNFEERRDAESSGRPYFPYGGDGFRGHEDDHGCQLFHESYNINRCMKDKGYRWKRLED